MAIKECTDESSFSCLHGVNNPINHDLAMPGRLGNLLDKKYWDLPTKTKFNRLLLTILPGGAMLRNAIRNADIRQLPKTGKFQHAELHQLNFACLFRD